MGDAIFGPLTRKVQLGGGTWVCVNPKMCLLDMAYIKNTYQDNNNNNNNSKDKKLFEVLCIERAERYIIQQYEMIQNNKK